MEDKNHKHDSALGCEGCKYIDRPDTEYPCCCCRGTSIPYAEEYYEKPHYWEPDAPGNVQIPMDQTVNHPKHYCQNDSMECIDEMVAVFGEIKTAHFCLLNVWKYRKRACYKGGVEDMKKSDWYMKKYIELKKEINNVVKNQHLEISY